jgi:hypothetical protein
MKMPEIFLIEWQHRFVIKELALALFSKSVGLRVLFVQNVVEKV